MVFGTTFSSQNLISETNKGNLILKIDEGFYQFIKDPSNYGEINIDGSQNIKIYPGLGITDICAIDLFIANRSSNMFSDNSHNCLQRDLSDIDFISYTCLSENTIYDISLDNSFVEITIEYKPNKLNKLNEIKTNDISVNRNSSKLRFFNSPKIFNNALRNDYSKYLITPEKNDEYNIPGRDLSGYFNNLIYYKSSKYEGDISTSLYIDDTSAEILTPVQLLNYKLLEIQEDAIKTDPSKNVFFNTYNWGDYTHPLSGFHLGALAYNNLLYNDLSYNSNEFYNNSGNYLDEETYRKLTIPYMANKYVKRINDISLNSDSSLVYNSEFNQQTLGKDVNYEDKNLLFNIDNPWLEICKINTFDISLDSSKTTEDMHNEISGQFFNIFNTDNPATNLIKSINGDTDISSIKTKLGLSEDSIGRDCEVKIEIIGPTYTTAATVTPPENRKYYFFKGYDLSSCFGFFNSEHRRNLFKTINIDNNSYDISMLYKNSGDILSEPGLMQSATSGVYEPWKHNGGFGNLEEFKKLDLSGGKIKYKYKYGYTFANYSIEYDYPIYDVILDWGYNNAIWSFYTNNNRFRYKQNHVTLSRGRHMSPFYDKAILWKNVLKYYAEKKDISNIKVKDILDPTYEKYLKFIDKNFFSFNEWLNITKSSFDVSNLFYGTALNALGPIPFHSEQKYEYIHRLEIINGEYNIGTLNDLFESKAFRYSCQDETIRSNRSRNISYASNDISYTSFFDKIKLPTPPDAWYSLFNYDIAGPNAPDFLSGALELIFIFIEFINTRNAFDNGGGKLHSMYNLSDFPFLALGFGQTPYGQTPLRHRLKLITDDNFVNSDLQHQGQFELRVYARKARQDINTKKLLDIKEFDKIPLFLYKDPFVNNHHQFEITSETIPTIYPALTCDMSSTISGPPFYNVTTFANINCEYGVNDNSVSLQLAKFTSPRGIAISSDNTFAIVADGAHRVYKINLSSNILSPLCVVDGPWGVAITPDGFTALVTSPDKHVIYKINIATGVGTIIAGGGGAELVG